MNNSFKSISLILAAGVTGVAAFNLANSTFVASLPAIGLLATGISAAVVALAIFDYSRRPQSLALPVRLLRPARPVVTNANFKSHRIDRLAA